MKKDGVFIEKFDIFVIFSELHRVRILFKLKFVVKYITILKENEVLLAAIKLVLASR